MGLFNSGWWGRKPKTNPGESKVYEVPKEYISIDGYRIERDTGTLVSVPIGLKKYIFPREVKKIEDSYALKNARATAEILDFSKTQINSSDLRELFDEWFVPLKQIIVPESFEEIDCTGYRKIYQGPITINIPRNLKRYNHRETNAWIEELNLPEGIEHIDTIGHNNRTKAIYIPGTLTDKKLPQIYQCCKLKKLTIGEGISAISENAYYFGLNNLEFVSLPSTLNEFSLRYFDQRMILFPDGNDRKHHGYMEKLTIEKAFGKGSYFGETKIKFEIPRKNGRPYFGKINIYFADDKVVINDYLYHIKNYLQMEHIMWII